MGNLITDAFVHMYQKHPDDAAWADVGATVVAVVAASRDVAHWKRMRRLSMFINGESWSSCEFLLSLRDVVPLDSFCADVTDVEMGCVNANAADNW